MKLFGIEFAPLNVPMERRLQTLAAATWFTFGVFGGPFCSFLTLFILLMAPNWLRLLIMAYLVFMYLDWDVRLKGGRWLV